MMILGVTARETKRRRRTSYKKDLNRSFNFCMMSFVEKDLNRSFIFRPYVNDGSFIEWRVPSYVQ